MGLKGDGIVNIPLKEVLEKCIQYQNGVLDQKDLSEWANSNFVIREYIPIQEKQFLIMDICFRYDFSDYVFTELKILESEKFKFFKCLLGEYTNIEIPLEQKEFDENCTFENYDILSPILEYYIYKHCSYDYDKLIKMIDNCFNYNNLQQLLEMLEKVDAKTLAENSKSNSELIQSLNDNKDLIKDLKDIAVFQDPSTKQLVENFKSEVLKSQLKKQNQKENEQDSNQDNIR